MSLALESVVDGRRSVQSAVSSGLLVPILGAACSSPGAPLEPRATERQRIRDSLEGVLKSLASDGPEVRDFAEAVARSNGVLFEGQSLKRSQRELFDRLEKSLRDDKYPIPLPEKLKGDLVSLQAAIARLGSLTSHLLATHARESRNHVDLIGGAAVDLGQADATEDFGCLLGDAVAEADRAARIARGTPLETALGADGILQKLIWLALETLTEPGKAEGRSSKVRIGDFDTQLREATRLASSFAPVGSVPLLRAQHAEWLAALFWHTMRYNARFYPSSSELAFQFAAGSYGVPPRCVDLATAGQALSEEEQQQRISTWFAYYGATGRDTELSSPLHLALAAYLSMQAARQKGAVNDAHAVPKRARGKPVAASKALRNLLPRWPVVLTTNYDLEMERALDRMCQPYGVLVPIFDLGRSKNGGRRSPRWLWTDIEFHGRVKGPAKRLVLAPPLAGGSRTSHAFTEQMNRLRRKLLVVKLHGSAEDTDRWDSSWIPRFVLSEATYWREILHQGADEVLRLIDDEVFGTEANAAQERLVLFLGHSVGDPNVRLRLAERSEPGGRKRSARCIAVTRRVDVFLWLVLCGLDLRVGQWELTEIVDWLVGMRELKTTLAGVNMNTHYMEGS